VRERASEVNPGEVTGYAVSLPGCTGADGSVRWYGGGQLHESLTLPQLQAAWARGGRGAAERSGASRITAPERAEIYRHAARQAVAAAEYLRRCAANGPGAGADGAWAAADTLHTAARATGSRVLSRAADGYDRAARSPHRQVPGRTRAGDGLRTAARLLAMAGGDGQGEAGSLARSLLSLVDAVSRLRAAQAHAAQAAAARQAAEQLHAVFTRARQHVPVATAARYETAATPSRPPVMRPPSRAGPAR
jgi:hypothetical protein